MAHDGIDSDLCAHTEGPRAVGRTDLSRCQNHVGRTDATRPANHSTPHPTAPRISAASRTRYSHCTATCGTVKSGCRCHWNLTWCNKKLQIATGSSRWTVIRPVCFTGEPVSARTCTVPRRPRKRPATHADGLVQYGSGHQLTACQGRPASRLN